MNFKVLFGVLLQRVSLCKTQGMIAKVSRRYSNNVFKFDLISFIRLYWRDGAICLYLIPNSTLYYFGEERCFG